ncbi:hypothetical protein [Runella slithyformis]|uniref:Uncharacterized protein n=1 Tax=Runella slithyformis (strain ATCC 29530 / DSM 19594 / LMG 11500 / NCIMB 11436 / LSU 4) TaxID=761193 RepID=A0A7U3ZI32_RUNSL|nr:hypothetical protein [Runella slithyformis]AEI47557.1 hypothetical protein Runsl_1128 [Runella slithyformis DSM 19594]
MKSNFFLFLFFAFLNSLLLQAQVKVNGYYRKDGTYVQPHYRSNPDNTPTNNWSYPGNTNPYTGKTATGSSNQHVPSVGSYNNTFGSSYSAPNSSTAFNSGVTLSKNIAGDLPVIINTTLYKHCYGDCGVSVQQQKADAKITIRDNDIEILTPNKFRIFKVKSFTKTNGITNNGEYYYIDAVEDNSAYHIVFFNYTNETVKWGTEQLQYISEKHVGVNVIQYPNREIQSFESVETKIATK